MRKRARHKRLFIDLDGVLAGFEAKYLEVFGKDLLSGRISDKELWADIESYEGDFFAELPLIAGALDAIRELKEAGYEIIYLTACPRSDYEYVARQKHDWVRMVLGDDESLVIPIVGGKNKCRLVQRHGDVLVDDFDKNLNAWRSEGGVGILFEGDWTNTLAEIYTAMREEDVTV